MWLGVAFGALLLGLMLFRADDPWRFPNDDNGAWYSAVARAHLQAGLRATRGQDFFLSRETGELVPYLHHPPLPGLILAAAFRLTGSTSPATARLTFALLHLVTFALCAALAGRVWSGAGQGALLAQSLAVASTVPMSAYYGKMPNHEVPGLLFLLLGVLAWGFPSGPASGRRIPLACAAWTLAVFSSWHAVLCVLGWLATQWRTAGGVRALAGLAWVAAALGAVVVHLLWAGDWALLASQSRSAKFWFAGSDGASLGERLGFLRHALGIGMSRYAQVPALLSGAWGVLLAIDRVRGRRLQPLERGLIGLGIGSAAYCLLFPRAVSHHAYQGFYLLPFVALTSSATLGRLAGTPFVRDRRRLAHALPAAAVALTCLLGISSTLLMYRKPSPRVIEAVATMERQYR